MPGRSAAPARARCGGIVLLVVACLLAPAASPPVSAGTVDPRLEQAQDRRLAIQRRLDALLGRLHSLRADAESTSRRLAALRRRSASQQRVARAAAARLEARLRDAYTRGAAGDPLLTVLASDSAAQAADQARLLAVVARRDAARQQTVAAARVRTRATERHVAQAQARLAADRRGLTEARAEVTTLLEQARDTEAQVRAEIAAEQAARRAARVQARASRAAVPDPTGAPATARGEVQAPATARGEVQAPAPDGIACPVGQPRSYTDTWGAPRSGGRVHMGTDILAPYGTPIYAYESGTVTDTSGSTLGGISLYLHGASGNVYYYTHLAGHAAGVAPGVKVRAGQVVASNGDTGNAAGIPHLHFEVSPAGSGSTNPYPYVVRACG